MVSEFVSRINVFLEIKDNRKILCQFKRHLSPRTVGLIVRSLPLHGNAHILGKSIVYLETKINSGLERKKTNFSKGDIAYLPVGGCICFYLNDVTDGQPMTPIGKLPENIDNLMAIKSGDNLTLYPETAL